MSIVAFEFRLEKEKRDIQKQQNGEQPDNDGVDVSDEEDGDTSESDDEYDDGDVDDRSISQGKQKQQEKQIFEENKKTSKKNGFEIAPVENGMCFVLEIQKEFLYPCGY